MRRPGAKKLIRAALLAAAAALIAVGLADGGYGGVLNKAVRICLECMGIG